MFNTMKQMSCAVMFSMFAIDLISFELLYMVMIFEIHIRKIYSFHYNTICAFSLKNIILFVILSRILATGLHLYRFSCRLIGISCLTIHPSIYLFIYLSILLDFPFISLYVSLPSFSTDL